MAQNPVGYQSQALETIYNILEATTSYTRYMMFLESLLRAKSFEIVEKHPKPQITRTQTIMEQNEELGTMVTAEFVKAKRGLYTVSVAVLAFYTDEAIRNVTVNGIVFRPFTASFYVGGSLGSPRSPDVLQDVVESVTNALYTFWANRNMLYTLQESQEDLVAQRFRPSRIFYAEQLGQNSGLADEVATHQFFESGPESTYQNYTIKGLYGGLKRKKSKSRRSRKYKKNSKIRR